MKLTQISLVALYAYLVTAQPTFWARTVSALDPAATQEAQQRDATATRAFTNTHIKTFNGQCLFVDKLSGDFRENLTPVQVAECGSINGQGWDIITAGNHNDQPNSTLVVSTLTNACLNLDPRRNPGGQVFLFSCGGRADGGGLVADSQLFAFTGGRGPLTFRPNNVKGKCLVADFGVLNVADCNGGDAAQNFILEGDNTGVWKPVNETKALEEADKANGIESVNASDSMNKAGTTVTDDSDPRINQPSQLPTSQDGCTGKLENSAAG
ncbi:unnamed protein product [Discula destructiva]